jgi:hypothetical protein
VTVVVPGRSKEEPPPRAKGELPRTAIALLHLDGDDTQTLTCGWPDTAAMKLPAMSPSRSVFGSLVHTVVFRIGIADAEADESAEHEIVVQLLHELELRAHRTEGVQRHGRREPSVRQRRLAEGLRDRSPSVRAEVRLSARLRAPAGGGHLRAAGRPLTAIMRKLLIPVDALIRDRGTWTPELA